MRFIFSTVSTNDTAIPNGIVPDDGVRSRGGSPRDAHVVWDGLGDYLWCFSPTSGGRDPGAHGQRDGALSSQGDGRYLLFNTSNVAPNIPSLQVATRIDAQTFEYQGEIQGEGVNEPGVLSGTPTMD